MDALAKQFGVTGWLDPVEVLDTARSHVSQVEEELEVLRSKIARIENGTLRSELTAFARVSACATSTSALTLSIHCSLPATTTVLDSGQSLSALMGMNVIR